MDAPDHFACVANQVYIVLITRHSVGTTTILPYTSVGGQPQRTIVNGHLENYNTLLG